MPAIPVGPMNGSIRPGKGTSSRGLGWKDGENEVNVKGRRMRFDVDAGLSMLVEMYQKPCP